MTKRSKNLISLIRGSQVLYHWVGPAYKKTQLKGPKFPPALSTLLVKND